jgi:hypothetical protein
VYPSFPVFLCSLLPLAFVSCSIKLLWKYRDNLQEAANQLAEESTRQWRKEEEVIDDITCIVVQFNAPK